MKIGLIGNVNNMLFPLTRYLRDMGYDAELLYCNDSLEYFYPNCDCYDLDYRRYCKIVDWNFRTFDTIEIADIKKEIDKYDFIIACGEGAAFVNLAGRVVDIYVMYGLDVYGFTQNILPEKFGLLSLLKRGLSKKNGVRKGIPSRLWTGTLYRYLRRAVTSARYFASSENNTEYLKMYEVLGIASKRLGFSTPFVYLPQYEPKSIEKYYSRSYWAEEFLKIRKEFQIVVFHHSRHIWKNRLDDYSFKGNDKLIRGFAKFVKERPDIKACLVTMEYGTDIFDSQALIKELGIEANVRWFPKMYRKDLMIGINLSDLCTGEFHHSFFLFGTVMEALAMAKPLIHYRKDELHRDYYKTLYPILPAKTEEEIYRALTDYAARPDYYKRMGQEGREWYQKNVVDEALQGISKILKQSPLR